MKNIFVLSLSLLLFACSENNAPPDKEKTTETQPEFIILALGDSLTEGLGVAEQDNYPSVLQTAVGEHNIKVINAGLSAETTSGLKNRLDWVLQQKPDLVILNSGANDAMRGIELPIIEQNLSDIITQIQQSGADVILAGMQIYQNLGEDYVDGFQAIYPRMAQQHNIPLIPFFLEHIAGLPQYNQDDLLHPNAEGYKIIVKQNILPVLNNYLKNKL